jgi:carboxyl-terminal PDZ ligand of neuronal nitric oxide synthase protein
VTPTTLNNKTQTAGNLNSNLNPNLKSGKNAGVFQFGSQNEVYPGISSSSSMAAVHEAHLLREKLDQQQQQTHAALAQINLLRDQLAAESTARIEAQVIIRRGQ